MTAPKMRLLGSLAEGSYLTLHWLSDSWLLRPGDVRPACDVWPMVREGLISKTGEPSLTTYRYDITDKGRSQVKGDAREEAPVALDETGQGVRR